MKRINLYLPVWLCLAMTFRCEAQNKAPETYELTVNTAALTHRPAKLYLRILLEKENGRTDILDSAVVRGSETLFKGKSSEPLIALLENGKHLTIARFVLEPGRIHIIMNDDPVKIQVVGSGIQEDYKALENKVQQIGDKGSYLLTELGRIHDKKDSVRGMQLWAAFAATGQEASNVYGDYIRSHAATSPLSVYAFGQMISGDAEKLWIDKLDSLFALLAPSFQQFPSALIFKHRVDLMAMTATGSQAPGFQQRDTAGKVVSLSDFRGRYVLIDFWASWCHPCREENPNLLKAWRRYHDAGFDILSVSLDSRKDDWIKALRHDQIDSWTHVSDLRYWNNEVALQYKISSVPQNFLLDPNGIIIAKNLRGGELETKLGGIFTTVK